MSINPRIRAAILKTIEQADGPIGSQAIARQITHHGFELSPRTIRLYLQEMEDEGLVQGAVRGRGGGRSITARGREEIRDASVAERVGYAAARLDTLTWQMDFDPATSNGSIVLNLTLIDHGDLPKAIDLMLPVFEAGLSMGHYLAVGLAGERLGDFRVPDGRAAIGTICSVTLNGALLTRRVPVISRFGGILEIDHGRPVRFTDVVHYEGTTLDPLEIFIRAGLTSVLEAVKTGRGRIGAGFREIPTAARGDASHALRRLERMGLGGVLEVGRPDLPLLDFAVPEGRTGLIVAGGLNPAAALTESGMKTENMPLSCLYEFSRLIHFREVRERLASGSLRYARRS